MKETRLTPIGSTGFSVRLDSRERGNYSGEYVSPASPSARKFSGLSTMFLMIDEELDRIDAMGADFKAYPHSKFQSDMEIEILFRQHCSWQGRVRLVKEGREATFRSVLELIIIMETVFGE